MQVKPKPVWSFCWPNKGISLYIFFRDLWDILCSMIHTKPPGLVCPLVPQIPSGFPLKYSKIVKEKCKSSLWGATVLLSFLWKKRLIIITTAVLMLRCLNTEWTDPGCNNVELVLLGEEWHWGLSSWLAKKKNSFYCLLFLSFFLKRNCDMQRLWEWREWRVGGEEKGLSFEWRPKQCIV